MITSDLIEYIKSQLNKNNTKDSIVSKLIQVGWKEEDIEEGFLTIESTKIKEEDFLDKRLENQEYKFEGFKSENINNQNSTEVEKFVDPYRELPDELDTEPVNNSNLPKVEKEDKQIKIEPINKYENLESNKVSKQDELVAKDTPVISRSGEIEEEIVFSNEKEVEPYKFDVQDTINPNIIVTGGDMFKEQTLVGEPNSKIEEEIVFSNEKEVEPYKFEIKEVEPAIIKSHEDRFKNEINSIKPVENIEIKKEEQKIVEPVKIWTPTTIETKVEDIKPVINIPKIETEETIKTAEIEKPIEFIPSINKNPNENLVVSSLLKPEEKIIKPEEKMVIPENINTPSFSPQINIPPLKIQNTKIVNSENRMSDVVQKTAMISSYTQDIISAKKDEPVVPQKKSPYLKIGVFIFILSIIGGMVFAFIEGYVKIPWLNINVAVVKKDPKTIMINSPLNISKLKSYKVETNINISSPSLSSITTGLSSGEVVTSNDKDSISINAKGSANHIDGGLSFDYLLNFKSSLLDKDINSILKFNGKDLYASVPDLSVILGENSPEPTDVSFKPNQIGLIIPEFSPSVQDKIKEIDIYNILSGEVQPYVKNEVALIFKEFIGKLEYIEKADESINGIDTYHYELTAGRQSTKKFLVSLANLFIVKITPEQKKNLDEALGSSTISSFEVWVGKNDDNLYQIKFKLNTPLSKVLGLNDSGIGNNEVELEWMTTYSDLDIVNEINLPEAQFDMDSFVKNIRDKKIKNLISSFKPQTVLFKNAVGSFGSRSNPTGSCVNPNPGSIFSPKGHVKGADASIASISSSMNSLLSLTNGAGYCYSTGGAWALSAPIFTKVDSETTSYYCTDSSGGTSTLVAPITGTVCK